MFFPCRGYNLTSPFEDSNVFNSDLCTLYSYSRILYPVLDVQLFYVDVFQIIHLYYGLIVYLKEKI